MVRNRYKGKSYITYQISKGHKGLDDAIRRIAAQASIRTTLLTCFVKLFQEHGNRIKVEYHVMEDYLFCSGLLFVKKPGGVDEDDGWLICYVHDEKNNVSQVHIIDAKNFTEKPVAKITLPQRVPYGFHAAFASKQNPPEINS
ncbi:hypothetical protein ACLOJK_040184 [Asimina triloba]